jgi:hypothetical protein
MVEAVLILMPDSVMVDIPLVIAVAYRNDGGVGTSDVDRGKGGVDATRRWLRASPHHHRTPRRIRSRHKVGR